MAQLECIEFELFKGRTLHLGFYRNVRNSAELRQQLFAQKLDYAFINAKLVVDLFQVQTAAARVLQSKQKGKLTTNSMHAELVYNLSGSRNVASSLKRFGIEDSTECLLVGVFDADKEKLQVLQEVVKGELQPLESLGEHLTPEDYQVIRKLYKIHDPEFNVSSLGDAIVTRIALKSCMK